MKLIVFLGNPGLKYRRTRHNLGFMVGDRVAADLGVKWKFDKKFAADVARQGDLILAKPQLFYNQSGPVVQKLMKFYKIANADLVVVCDDLNLDFGVVRQREQGSDGGNNGLKSIIDHLGPDFARIRIGTNNNLRAQLGDTDFVLAKFSREEAKALPEIISQVAASFRT
jgi:PTH1 family peptidyl-tRNA hydrolase